jgi:hypothetical protein
MNSHSTSKQIQPASVYFYALGYGVLLSVICFIIGFNGLYGQDSYEYLRFSKALMVFFQTGKEPGSFFWPIGYPLAGALVGLIIQNVQVAMLVVTIISSVLTFIFLHKTLLLFYEKEEKEIRLFLILFFCLSPFVFRSSLVIMSDMMTVAGISVAFYYYFYFFKHKKSTSFLLFIIFASLSITIRYVAIVVLFIPLISLFGIALRSKKNVCVVSGIFISLVVFIPHLYLKSNAPLAFVRHDWVTQWSVLNLFRNVFVTADGFHHYSLINAVYVFSNVVYPGYLFAGVIFLCFFKKENFTTIQVKIILASFFLYALFLSGMPIQNQRFLLLSYPLVLLLFYPSFILIIQKNNIRNYFKIIVGAVVLIQIILLYRAFLPQYRLNKQEREIVVAVKKYPNHTIIYTSGMEGALGAYGAMQERKSLYLERLSSVQPGSLLLVNPPELEAQWQGKNPERNWDFIKTHYTLRKLETLPNGWELYEIQ